MTIFFFFVLSFFFLFALCIVIEERSNEKEEKRSPFFVVGDCFGREGVVCCLWTSGERVVGVGFGRAIGQEIDKTHEIMGRCVLLESA